MIPDLDWPMKRQKESKGFVAERLLRVLVGRQCLLYGSSFVLDLGQFRQLLNPWDVVLLTQPR